MYSIQFNDGQFNPNPDRFIFDSYVASNLKVNDNIYLLGFYPANNEEHPEPYITHA